MKRTVFPARNDKSRIPPGTARPTNFISSTNVSEWDDELVTLGLEDEGMFTENGIDWVDGYPSAYYLIK